MLRAIGTYLGMSANTEAASNPKLLDITKTKFDPQNADHLTHIDERLQNFTAKRDALLSFDKKMMMAMGLDTVLWLSGFTGGWGPYVALAGYLFIYYSAKQYGRDTLKHDFDGALDEMYSIYQWYTKEQGPAVTNQPRYQELLSALIPFTNNWQKLIFWDLKHLGHNEISPRVVEIFEQSPHKAVAGVLQLDTQPAKIEMPKAPIFGLPDPQSWVAKSGHYQFFVETAANAKLKLLYGHDFENEVKEVPQPRRG